MKTEGNSRQDPNGGLRPVPDPTVLTTDQLLRAIAAERDFVEQAIEGLRRAISGERGWVDAQFEVIRERLSGIDRATELRLVNLPTDVDEKVRHLKELTDERFESIATQFKERDTRSERESRDNKVAVDAAFAAQKEAASEQNKSNTLAINKSEEGTKETINKQGDLNRTEVKALSDKYDDLKERLARIEATKAGGQEVRQEQLGVRQETRLNYGAVLGGVSVLLVLVFGVISIVLTTSR